MSKPVISVEHLTKRYDLGVIGTGTLSRDVNRWWARLRKQPDPYTRIGQRDAFERIGESILALDDVSFTVEQGEALGIIGRNGAGKSTLLKILSRVTAPTSGVVKVKGRIGSLLEVGTGFHPELTGCENIYLNGAILGMKKAEVARKFDEIVDFAGVEKFIDTPVKRYSSGMYVRLAFAVAAHLDPEILVVDEVLAVGDAEFQKKCLGKMGDISSNEGRTVLFVSHNMIAISHLCPKSLLLEEGIIKNFGSSSFVISKYLENKNQEAISLRRRKDRSGNGWMRFQDYELYDIEGNLISNVQTGQSFSIGLKYETSLVINGPAVINIDFYTVDGQKIFQCLSRNSSKDNLILRKQGTIFCNFPKFPLLPGKYRINLWCKINEVIADQVNDALCLEVNSGDFFGTGKLNPDLKNGLLVEHNWNLN